MIQPCFNDPVVHSNWIIQSKLSINTYLDNYFDNNRTSPLHQAVRHAVLAPGKRLRPLLLLAVLRYFNQDEMQGLNIACAIETVHAASLVFDDLPCMDDDNERRAQPATHHKYGESVAILAGISLLTSSYAMISTAPIADKAISLAIVTLLSDTIGTQGLSLGQSIDLSGSKTGPDIHDLKTGVLFKAAVRSGCLIAGASASDTTHLMQYAHFLGLAFQLCDDLKDVEKSENNLADVMGETQARHLLKDYKEQALLSLKHGNGDITILKEFLDVFLET